MCFIDSPNGVRSCLHCGKESKNRKFCSVSCAAKHRADQIRIVRVCQICGKNFHKKRGQSKGICCGRECGFEWLRRRGAERRAETEQKQIADRTHPCMQCGNPVIGRAKRLCVACKAQRTKGTMRRCKQCGCLMERRQQKVSCDRCIKIRRWCTRKQYDHARRARMRQVSHQKINPLDIYNRDGWICGICGKPVMQTVKYPDLNCVSLDHIVPLAKGGTHTRDNVQCAHMICNSLKSDKINSPTPRPLIPFAYSC